MAVFEYYKNSNKNYSNNGDIRIPMITGTLTLEINTTNEVEIDISYDKYKLWKQIERFGVIKVKVPYTKNKQLYRIYDLEKDMLTYKIKARHIFFDLVNNILLDVRPTDCNVQDALDKILANTGFTGQSNITTTNTSYYVNKNCIQAINGDIDQSIINRWGGEILQDNFNIIINDRLGGDYGVKIKYSLNMDSVSLDDNLDNIYTRIYPTAYDGIMLPEKYVDSPIISNYPIVKTNFVSMEDLRLKDSDTETSTSDDDSTTYFDTEQELYQAMRNRCKTLFDGGLDKPSPSGSVSMIVLENTLEYQNFENLVNVGLGDTVTVEYLDIGIDVKTRCTGFEYDLTTEKYNKIDLGTIQANYFNSQTDISTTVSNILNTDGSVKAESVQGIINGTKTKMQVMRNVASDSQVKALIFEDKVKGSATYGAMALGTMGFMIANERTSYDKDWNWKTFGTGAGFVANMLTSGTINTNNIKITNNDNTLEIDGTCLKLLNSNGQLTATLQNFGLNIYDCFNAGSFVGGIQSVENNTDTTLRALQIYADNISSDKNYISLGNAYKIDGNGNRTFNGNIEIHKDYNTINSNTNIAKRNIDFVDGNKNYVGGIKYFDDDTIGFCCNWDKTMKFCYENDGKWTYAMTMLRDDNPRWQMWGGLQVNGDLSVSGTKNRTVDTKNFGTLKVNAYETAEAFFGDIGEITLDSNGYCKVLLEDKFKETIENDDKYHIFLTKYGRGDVFILERNKDFFILQGTPNLTVGYEIKAKQLGYKDVRLEEFKNTKEDKYGN